MINTQVRENFSANFGYFPEKLGRAASTKRSKVSNSESFIITIWLLQAFELVTR